MRPEQATLEMLFENAPRFVDRLAGRDYASWDEVLKRGEELARTLPEDEQLELIDGHPRIGALPSSVSATSYHEQGYDRDLDTAALQERLDRLNAQYEARHGFRFCVFVNGRSRAEIADVLESHLTADRDAELDRALTDVFAIARSRLSKLSVTTAEGAS
ncbi:MAG: allantoinase [Chloroflexota bacterium]|jgi:2-oxo-4-hydroxy-4-carboxy--5-ureidoimidazoline (OHCU) decarboxylase|nr:allantoinase [Chloroflexota bacterium]